MKKYILYAFVLLFIASLGLKVQAQEIISSFDTQIFVNQDASFLVQETIVYDFSNLQRHGIYRDIPVKYQSKLGNYSISLDDISVTDQTGKKYPFEVQNLGNNKRIKIGDSNLTVTGQHTYIINYTVKRAIVYSQDYDEIYWNVTGNDWPVAITDAQTTIILPTNNAVEASDIIARCYAGYFGSTYACSQLSQPQFKQLAGSDSIILTAHHYNLQIEQGMTMVVELPKGLLWEPSRVDRVRQFIWDNIILVLPLLVLIGMAIIWYRRGRDPRGRGTIIAMYEPPQDLSPAEVGTIIDEQADFKDIVAEMIQLAINGYLKIERVEEKKFLGKSVDYIIKQLKEADAGLKNFEEQLLFDLFRIKATSSTEVGVLKQVKLSDLQNKFQLSLEQIRQKIYATIVKRGYFAANPRTTKAMYLTIGLFVFLAGELLAKNHFNSPALIFSTIASGLIIALIGWFMPRRTQAGVLAREHILGFKEFLTVTEKDRLKFHNAPEKNPQMFEKFLSFAIALGVEKQWAKQFEGMDMPPPNWYGGSVGSFNTVLLVHNLNNFSSAAKTNLGANPSSGSHGGGMSGGGFGGGGGGSW